jgi:hypothetical protein
MPRLLLLLVSLMLAGCQHFVTQKRSNELISVIPNLYYQQVIDNVAMISADPAGLPFFGLPTQSTDTNTRQMNAAYTPGWDFITNSARVFGYLFDKQQSTIGGQMMNAEAFQLQPLSDPDKLTLIQIALRIATGEPITSGEKYLFECFYASRNDTLPIYYYYYFAITHRCLDDIKCPNTKCVDPRCCVKPVAYISQADAATGEQSFGPTLGAPEVLRLPPATPGPGATATTDPPKPPPKQICPPLCPANDKQVFRYPRAEWFVECDRKKDVPKSACYVGHFGNKWVWVPAERKNEFTGFTLALLDLASLGSQTAGRLTTGISPDKLELVKQFVALQLQAKGPRALEDAGVNRQLNTLLELLATPEVPAPSQPLLPSRVTPFPFPTPPGM